MSVSWRCRIQPLTTRTSLQSRGWGQSVGRQQKLRGIVMHNTLAVTAAGLPLGELHQQLWVRPETEATVEESGATD